MVPRKMGSEQGSLSLLFFFCFVSKPALRQPRNFTNVIDLSLIKCFSLFKRTLYNPVFLSFRSFFCGRRESDKISPSFPLSSTNKNRLPSADGDGLWSTWKDTRRFVLAKNANAASPSRRRRRFPRLVILN